MVIARPLVGEPLSLDLLNTTWSVHDVLAEATGVRAWLAERGLATDVDAAAPLREVRAVLRGVIERPGPEAGAALDGVLERGRLRWVLREGRGVQEVEVEPRWRPGWLAAVDYLDLLARAPDRIRQCDHAGCTLYFFDVSRNGTRRWCSMEGCGNRAKATRHYRRARRSAADPAAEGPTTGGAS